MEIVAPVLSRIKLNPQDMKTVAVGFITQHLLGYDGTNHGYSLPSVNEEKGKFLVDGTFSLGDELLDIGAADDEEIATLVSALRIIAKSDVFNGPLRKAKKID